MEVERVDRERIPRIFCEKHRPLKIVRELHEKDKQTLDEVHKFSKVIDKCLEKSAIVEAKILKQKRMAPFSKPALPPPLPKRNIQAEKRQEKKLNLQEQRRKQKEAREEERRQQKLKKEAEKQEKEKQKILAREASLSKPVPANRWKDKEVKVLYDRVRDRYLQLAKLRFNVVKVDPSIKMKKQLEKI